MSFSRRRFMRWAASASTLAVATHGRSDLLGLVEAQGSGYRPNLLPAQKAVWDEQVWMAKLGPKYTGNYRATGKNEWSIAITPDKSMGNLLVDALKGSVDRAAAVNPVNGGWLGEGGGLSRAGIPTIGYIPQPNYLLAGPADGCIDKLSPELLHSQIEVFAKLILQIDAMSAAQLKGG